MDKTIAITVIVLVAVVMGMSTFAPAVMAAPNDKAKANFKVCHWGTGPDGVKGTLDDAWEVIFVHSKGGMKGHVDRHFQPNTDFKDFQIVDAGGLLECIDRNEIVVVPNPD